jgi:hypothetical protein
MERQSKKATTVRRRARGRNLNLLFTLLGVIAAYVGWRLISPEIAAYEIKGTMKVVCNEYMRNVFYNEKPQTWEKKWSRRVRSLGIPMNKNQYRFKVLDGCNTKKCSCDAEAVFQLKTPWVGLDQFFDIPPRVTTHRNKLHVDYRAVY